MQTETAGEEPVAESDLRHLVAGQAAGGQETGAQLRPELQVVVGVTDEGRFAGGAARSVNAGQLRFGDGEEAERVIVA